MQKIKSIVLLIRISVVLSIVSFIMALISIISINKINNDIVNIATSEGKGFSLIGKVPDVEIIRPDGSIDKIKANESNDKLNDIIENKVAGKKKEEKKELKQNLVLPKKDDKKDNTKNDKVIKNVDKKVETNKENISKNDTKTNINKKEVSFYIQIGAFTKQDLAEKQCKNIKKSITNGKQCIVIMDKVKDKENKDKEMFKSVVSTFKDKKEAEEFLKSNNLIGFIKKK